MGFFFLDSYNAFRVCVCEGRRYVCAILQSRLSIKDTEKKFATMMHMVEHGV